MKAGSNTVLICREKTLDLATPAIMGILNVTPDSFSDGGSFLSTHDALKRVDMMIEQGAKIIDIGGESTRPGSDPVSVEEEIDRVIPVIEQVTGEFENTLFSIDTTKYKVARAALEAGVQIVNDVSGLQNEPRLAELCAQYNAALVVMHSQGDPKTMQENPFYEDVISDLKDFFKKQIKKAFDAGVRSLILDPGIGFGKTLQHNLKIIANLDKFAEFNYPLLIGASRKSMIGQILDGRPVEDRLTGTVAVHYHCLMKSARILRVHDVKDACDSIKIFNAVKTAET